jgi:hypothetical protein
VAKVSSKPVRAVVRACTAQFRTGIGISIAVEKASSSPVRTPARAFAVERRIGVERSRFNALLSHNAVIAPTWTWAVGLIVGIGSTSGTWAVSSSPIALAAAFATAGFASTK